MLSTEKINVALQGNLTATVIASQTLTATANGADQLNPSCRGVKLTLNITAASGNSPTLSIKIQSKCPTSNQYTDIVGTVFATQNSTTSSPLVLVIYPGVAAAQTLLSATCSLRRGEPWQLSGGGTPSFTFSLGAAYVN